MSRLARWQVGRLAGGAAVGAVLLLVAGCVAAPRPLPEPPTFRSLLAVPQPKPVYVPLMAGPSARLGKGVAAPYSPYCEDAERVGAGWVYTWGPKPICSNVVALPMQWGRFDVKTCPALGDGPVVLGFNEPDRPDQANMTPHEAAVLWQRLTVECYPERVFATPAVPLGRNYLAGLDWLSNWVTEYVRLYGEQLPRATYMAVHCFTWSDPGGAEVCKLRLRQAEVWARGHFLDGIIVSEWAMLPGTDFTPEQAIAQADEFLRWMESNPYIIGHAWVSTRIQGDEKWWFGPERNTALLDFTTDALTAFGVWYRER